MILRDVAEDIGMHESTMSRVTTNKYVHTPEGIFELKYFFNSSIARSDGDDLASEAVKLKIKQIIVGRGHPPSPFRPEDRRAAGRPGHRDRPPNRGQVPRAAPDPLLEQTPTSVLEAPIALAEAGFARRSQSAGGFGDPLRVPIRIVVRLAVYRSSRPRSGTWRLRRRFGPAPRSDWTRSASISSAYPIAAHATFSVERNHNHTAEFNITLPNGIVIRGPGDDRGHVFVHRPGRRAHRAPGAQVEGQVSGTTSHMAGPASRSDSGSSTPGP